MTADFTLIQDKSEIALNSQTYHGGAVLKRCDGSTTQTREACGNKIYLFQTGRFGNFFGYAQVTVVDRIESSTENANETKRVFHRRMPFNGRQYDKRFPLDFLPSHLLNNNSLSQQYPAHVGKYLDQMGGETCGSCTIDYTMIIR